MTNAAKDYEGVKNSLHRLSYKAFLSLQREIVEYHLEFSLILDGRFYGSDYYQ